MATEPPGDRPDRARGGPLSNTVVFNCDRGLWLTGEMWALGTFVLDLDTGESAGRVTQEWQVDCLSQEYVRPDPGEVHARIAFFRGSRFYVLSWRPAVELEYASPAGELRIASPFPFRACLTVSTRENKED